MTQNDTTLTTAQRRGIAALLTARDIQSAAEAAGVSRKTLYRWLQLDAFRRELHQAEEATIAAAASRLSGMQAEALDALADVFARSDAQSDLNIAEFFVEGEYTDPKTQQVITRQILDFEKVKEFGKLVKKVKTTRAGLEVEAYDSLHALAMKQRAAETVLTFLMRLKEFNDLEARIRALEEKS